MAPREQQGELQKFKKKFYERKNVDFLTDIKNIIYALKKILLKNEIFRQQKFDDFLECTFVIFLEIISIF